MLPQKTLCEEFLTGNCGVTQSLIVKDHAVIFNFFVFSGKKNIQ